MVTNDPKDLIGRTYLKDTEADGQRFGARFVRAIVDHEEDINKQPEYVKFLCKIPDSNIDEILSYNDVFDRIEKDQNEVENDTEQQYRFRCISAHQGPLRSTDKDWKGSTYNVLVEWETGESTYEPLDIIGKDDPVSCAEYAMKQNLLDTPGRKRCRSYAKNIKKIERLVKQAKLKSYQRDPFWKFGVLVSRKHQQAPEIQ